MSSGGSAFEALTCGDIQGLLMSCEATPLIWSMLHAQQKIGLQTERHKVVWHSKEYLDEDGEAQTKHWCTVEKNTNDTALNEFQRLLVPWTYNRLQDKHKGMPLSYIAKNHTNALNASYELSEGLAKYLARHKVKADKMGMYFEIEKSKFSRYYAPFIRECVADLEAQLGRLERQIKEKLQNNE